VNKRLAEGNYFVVESKGSLSSSNRNFRQLSMPDGTVVTIVKRQIFDKAVNEADQKLREVLRGPDQTHKKPEVAA
jgi:hypothetical protein